MPAQTKQRLANSIEAMVGCVIRMAQDIGAEDNDARCVAVYSEFEEVKAMIRQNTTGLDAIYVTLTKPTEGLLKK